MDKKRTITDIEKQMLLELDESDITKSFLIEMFSDRYDTSKSKIVKSKFNTYDEFVLKKGDYPSIKEDILTNCGLFIVNKFLYEKDWVGVIGYMNTPMNNSQIKKIDTLITSVVLEDETGEAHRNYIKYLNKLTWLELTFHTEICSSLSLKSSKPLPETQKRKKQLLTKYKKEIEEGDVDVAVKIQSELIQMSKELLKDDQTIELYDSGARGAFDNAYRQDQLIKGPIYNAANKRYEIMTNSLYEGADKADLAAFANAVVSGQYPKAVGTRESGYAAKKINAALQSEVLDERGTDCKSKSPETIELTKDNVTMYKYHYIIDGDKPVRLDDTTSKKYIGKTVRIRMPSTCTGSKICNICAGDRFYLLGTTEVGLTANRLANSLLQGGMKLAHDTTVRTFDVSRDIGLDKVFVKL